MRKIKPMIDGLFFVSSSIFLGYLVLIAVYIIWTIGAGAMTWICLTGVAFVIGSALIVAENKADEAEEATDE
ncbi:hypothetical protein [Neobacillus mesonae]|uniref:Uncharacterized protein n=1 Tax=Neobacillus mesonae TaxID=1193713 RepID=A0A3T0HVM5_9BACI|nr:hypothetical protein [Neobacillus mesonae]AZU61018.1 hypothetical protein CHR53_07000 [Neobacillus mesonae]